MNRPPAPRSVPAGRGGPPRRREAELPRGGNGTCHRSNGRRSRPNRLRRGRLAVNPSVPAAKSRRRRPVPQRSPAAPGPSRRGPACGAAPAPQRNPQRRECLKGRPGSAPPPGPPRHSPPNGSSALTQRGGRPGSGARLRRQPPCRLHSWRSRRPVSVGALGAAGGGGQAPEGPAGPPCPGRLVFK